MFLVTPPLNEASDADQLTACLQSACAIGDVACLLVRSQGAPAETRQHIVAALRQTARNLDIALLIEGQAADALALGTDGLHLPSSVDYADARRTLGPESNIGVTCHARDEAMTMADDGADYVAFGEFNSINADSKTIDMVGWWAELMNVPCIGAGGTTPESCRAVIRAGADFLAPAPALWTGPEGAEGIRLIMLDIADFQKSRR